jgi:hypothetical protein
MAANGAIPIITNGYTNGVGDADAVGAAAAPPAGLSIVIVGAGIGGLTAAIFLRRNGHRVTLLEQSRFANELGAAVHLAPNANGILRNIGIYAEKLGANAMNYVSAWTVFCLDPCRLQLSY